MAQQQSPSRQLSLLVLVKQMQKLENFFIANDWKDDKQNNVEYMYVQLYTEYLRKF